MVQDGCRMTILDEQCLSSSPVRLAAAAAVSRGGGMATQLTMPRGKGLDRRWYGDGGKQERTGR